MNRLVPYRSKASEEVVARIEHTLTSTMYLVQTSGPTSYVIQEQNSEKKHRVLIGAMQSCSCGTADICTHILFVMLKVLRVPPTTPVVWQKSLIDSEVETLLRGGYRERTRPPPKPYVSKRKGAPDAPQVEDTVVERHDLVEGEVCAICQEDMEDNQPLTFCRKGCGNNFHIECMKVFGESRRQSKENIVCPLCRQDWGDLALSALRKEIDVANRAPNVHKGTSCRKCKTKPIRCERYRCIQCRNVDLCARCFKANAHGKHLFVVKHNVPDPWIPAVRETQRQPAISSDIIRDLENRELSTNDYDVLLQLDHGDKIPIQDYLIKTISGTKVDPESATTFGEPGATCALCSHILRIKTALLSTECGHVFHESCLSRSLLSQVYACPYPGCECALVPGLLYLQKKKQQKTKTALQNDAKPESPNAMPPLAPSLTVLGFQQHSLPAPVIGLGLSNAPRSRASKRGDSRCSQRGDRELPSLPELVSVGLMAQDRKVMHTMRSNLPALSARGSEPSINQVEHEDATPTESRASSAQRARTKGKLVKSKARAVLPHLDQQQSLPQFPSDTNVTEYRLNQAEKIRAELKAVEQDRLQKQRLQREERQRRHKESHINLASFTGAFLGAPGHEHDNEARSQANSRSGQRSEMKRKSNHGRQHRAQNQNQFPSTLPDLFIGSKG